jgi:hypothetical protein
MSIELIAKEYNKQDGSFLGVVSSLNAHSFPRCCDEGLDRDPEQGLSLITDLWRPTRSKRRRVPGS